jgi:hypothetical protein
MNPLSPLTYYRRHKRAALVLIALIALATMVLYAIIGVLDSLTLGLHLSYLSRLSLVRPEAGRSLEPGVISRIQAHPDVERVIPDNGVTIYPPTLAGNEALRLIGASFP